jgi:DNA-binding XRE family transcriptional regulator
MKSIEINKLTLEQLRKINNLSQTEMAKKLELSLQGYTKKEKHQRKFSADELYEMSKMFEVPLEDMYKIINNE